MWSAIRDPSPHYFAHIELIPKVRSHLGNMIWGGSANLTAKKNGCKYIYSYIYTCTHTYILRTYHQSMWMLANGHICWSIPSHFPNLVAEAPYILAGWIQKLPCFTRTANSQVGVPKSGVPRAVTADDAWTYQAVQLIVPQHGGRGASAEMVSQLAGPVSCD